MKERLNIKLAEFLVACVLTFALLLPNMLQFSHIFEGHEHKVCSEASSHLHEADVDCSFHEYQISTFTFEPLQSFETLSFQISSKTQSFEEQLKYANLIGYTSLRGPPSFI